MERTPQTAHAASTFGAVCLALWVVALAAPAGAIEIEQMDDFQNGTTQSWQLGPPSPNPPTNVADGGPGGTGDRFLEVTSTGTGGAGGFDDITALPEAENSAQVILTRLDDALSPAAQFELDVTLEIEEPGVTTVTVQAGSVPLTFEEFEPGSGEWEQVEDTFFADFAELQSDLDGIWTLTIDGAEPSTSTFTLDAAGLVDADFFPTPTNLSPAHGETDVLTTTLLSWTDPTGTAIPYAMVVWVENDVQDSQEVFSVPELGVEEIPIDATEWQPPFELLDGPSEFAVFYADVDGTAISAFSVSAGAINWGNAPIAPPGYPTSTPLLVLASETIVEFTVPEPSAALLGGTALVALFVLARRRLPISRQSWANRPAGRGSGFH